jgi:hypothetical protein
MRRRLVCSLGVVLAVAACGSPAPAPAPSAATPATPPAPKPPASAGTPVVMDPKGTLDAVRSTAAVASAATVARTQSTAGVKPGAPIVSAAGAAAAETALAPTAAKYDAQGRRDPFESLQSRFGSERSTIASARLTGVIQSPGSSAYALVETSDGIGYILKPGDTLAEGRLVEIGHNMVVFSIAPKPGAKSNRVVLKLPE